MIHSVFEAKPDETEKPVSKPEVSKKPEAKEKENFKDKKPEVKKAPAKPAQPKSAIRKPSKKDLLPQYSMQDLKTKLPDVTIRYGGNPHHGKLSGAQNAFAHATIIGRKEKSGRVVPFNGPTFNYDWGTVLKAVNTGRALLAEHREDYDSRDKDGFQDVTREEAEKAALAFKEKFGDPGDEGIYDLQQSMPFGDREYSPEATEVLYDILPLTMAASEWIGVPRKYPEKTTGRRTVGFFPHRTTDDHENEHFMRCMSQPTRNGPVPESVMESIDSLFEDELPPGASGPTRYRSRDEIDGRPTQDKSSEDEEGARLYFKLNDHDCIVVIEDDGRRWRETEVYCGTPPDDWGGKTYMSYLKPDDLESWLSKDYGSVTYMGKNEEGEETACASSIDSDDSPSDRGLHMP